MKNILTLKLHLSSVLCAFTLLLATISYGQPTNVKMHVEGHLFVQTNLGNMSLGFPDNGARWELSTNGSGAHLQFGSKANGSNIVTTRFKMNQGGELQLGTTTTPSAWAHILNNSTASKPHLQLQEVGNDYARLEFGNTSFSTSYWQIQGYASTTATSGRLKFTFSNPSGTADRMVLTGDGELGINGTPTARLELYQNSQSVGTGLRFDDGTVNSDWDITHGFALRFHYGGALRGFINATTGEYVQSSDERLKSDVVELSPIMDKVSKLRPTTYHYTDSKDKKTTVGFIAQEVLPIFPELVSYSEADQLYGINYAGFSVIAIKALQELQEVLVIKEKKIDNLEARLARLESLLNID